MNYHRVTPSVMNRLTIAATSSKWLGAVSPARARLHPCAATALSICCSRMTVARYSTSIRAAVMMADSFRVYDSRLADVPACLSPADSPIRVLLGRQCAWIWCTER